MIGCTSPYVLGNVAFCQYSNYPGLGGLPQQSYMCACPCHQSVWFGVYPPQCWCNCSKTQIVKIVTDNSMTQEVTKLQLEIAVLRETIKGLEARLEPVERWKKTAKVLCDQSKKPHKCPVCFGDGGWNLISAEEMQNNDGKIFKTCKSCEGKGILWG